MDTLRNSMYKIILLVLFVAASFSFWYCFGKYVGDKYNPKDEIVYQKCINGTKYAMNKKGYKRQLLDENNNPLVCTE